MGCNWTAGYVDDGASEHEGDTGKHAKGDTRESAPAVMRGIDFVRDLIDLDSLLGGQGGAWLHCVC